MATKKVLVLINVEPMRHEILETIFPDELKYIDKHDDLWCCIGFGFVITRCVDSDGYRELHVTQVTGRNIVDDGGLAVLCDVATDLNCEYITNYPKNPILKRLYKRNGFIEHKINGEIEMILDVKKWKESHGYQCIGV